MSTKEQALVAELWHEHLGATSTLPALELTGPGPLLPSPFQLDVLASASVALATACAAGLWAVRTGRAARAVALDRRHAVAAFRSERYAKLLGRATIPTWDAITGDYETSDGFIRLHTNYRSHRDAALRVLGVPAEREAVTRAVRTFQSEALELAIVEAGGAAAMLRERTEFAQHAQGKALAGEPLFGWSSQPARAARFVAEPVTPLAGVRVLDLTRVIAGPVSTRFLSAYGADVLRIDPPDFEEVASLLPDTTVGKRRAALDLRSRDGQDLFKRLVQEAHVLVIGYRPDALARLGLGSALRKALNPALVTILIDAYGYEGPWAQRRGFDSLVQMTSGIAAVGRAWQGCREPFPLPAQALDHATGYFAAAAACHGLTRALMHAEGCEGRVSLARCAELLFQLGTDTARAGRELRKEDVAPYLETVDTPWGRAQRLSCPGAIQGCAPSWSLSAGPLGTDAPSFGA